jgi:thiol-disulfide isomerase/thioredoxin
MQRHFIRLLALLMTVGTLAFAQTAGSATKKQSITVTDVNGKKYEISGTPNGLKIPGTEGKVVFLEFFGHRCPPCLATIPHFIKLQEKFKDKLVIFAVEVQGYDTPTLKEFGKRAGINYILASGNDNRLFVSYIAQRAQWQGGIPFLIVMDTKGEVQDIREGFPHNDAFLESLVTQNLKK